MKNLPKKPWKLETNSATGQKFLFAKYEFNDFKQAMSFANEVGEIAEKLFHHPEITVAWGYCIIKSWTHDIQFVTEKDYELAQKISVAANAKK